MNNLSWELLATTFSVIRLNVSVFNCKSQEVIKWGLGPLTQGGRGYKLKPSASSFCLDHSSHIYEDTSYFKINISFNCSHFLYRSSIFGVFWCTFSL